MDPRIAPLFACAVLTACASAPQRPPIEHDLTLARHALDKAAVNNVADYATPTLNQARKDYASAQTALDAGKLDVAQNIAKKARLEAQLAEAQAEYSRARANKLQMQRDIERMKNAARLPGEE